MKISENHQMIPIVRQKDASAYPAGSIRITCNPPECHPYALAMITTPNEDQYFGRYCQQTNDTQHQTCLLSHWYDSCKAGRTNAFGQIGVHACRPVRCVPLTATHYRLRLAWSREQALGTP
ncbi:hypothetical protein TNCV_3965011 [Trichonephila clavipes]|nr:hypothetical protein TNCV_3965011 [Trichonephila clavipes]